MVKMKSILFFNYLILGIEKKSKKWYFYRYYFLWAVGNMYLVEKIGQLILVTLEGPVKEEEVESIKKQLKEIAAKERIDDEELVVSLSIKPAAVDETTPEMQKYILEIVEYCKECGLRLYSYQY